MANDRIYIQCKACGKEHAVAKYHYWEPDIYVSADNALSIQSFLKSHLDTCWKGKFESDTLQGETCFQFTTESGKP